MKKMTKKEIEKIREDVKEFIRTKLMFEDVGTSLHKTYIFLRHYETITPIKNYGMNCSMETGTVDILLDFKDGTNLAFTIYEKA